MSSSSRVSLACCSPETSFSYSFCSLSASVLLILWKTSAGKYRAKAFIVLLDLVADLVDAACRGVQHWSRQIDR